MCSCHSIPECCVLFSGVKLSMGSFVLFLDLTRPASSNKVFLYTGLKTMTHMFHGSV